MALAPRAAFALVVLWAARAAAWGPEGHQVSAGIAELLLSPAARSEVAELLSGEPVPTLPGISTWADEIRLYRRESGPWHYVNVPIGASVFDLARDCPRQDCVLAALPAQIAILRNRTLLPPLRREALKWVVHLVADIHQPLHVGDNGDRGGNDLPVRMHGQDLNLHRLWDTDLPRYRWGGQLPSPAALLAGLSPTMVQSWRGGTYQTWADESHLLAREMAYGQLAAGADRLPPLPVILPPHYIEAAAIAAEQRILQAGVRLAELLNEILN